MSKNESGQLLLREQLNATSGPLSKSETTQTARVLRDDELDAVSGGALRLELENVMIRRLELENTLISNYS